MRFPSKITSYKESIISKLPILLEVLKVKDYSVESLYNETKKKLSIKDFIDALDCLYVLGEITINKEVIHYVNRNTI